MEALATELEIAPSPELVYAARRRKLEAALWRWGAVTEAGKDCHVSITRYERMYGKIRRNFGPKAMLSTDADASYIQIEGMLEGSYLYIKHLLWFQYARAVRIELEAGTRQDATVQKSIKRSIEAYVAEYFAAPLPRGGHRKARELALPPREFDNIVRSLRKIRKQWVRDAIEELF